MQLEFASAGKAFANTGVASMPSAAWQATTNRLAVQCVQCSDEQHSVAACLALACNYGLRGFQKKCRTFFLDNMDDLASCTAGQKDKAAFTKQLAEQLAAPQLAQLLVSVLQAHRQGLNALAGLAGSLLEVWEEEYCELQQANGKLEDLKESVQQALLKRRDCVGGEIQLTPSRSYPLPFTYP